MEKEVVKGTLLPIAELHGEGKSLYPGVCPPVSSPDSNGEVHPNVIKMSLVILSESQNKLSSHEFKGKQLFKIRLKG